MDRRVRQIFVDAEIGTVAALQYSRILCFWLKTRIHSVIDEREREREKWAVTLR